MTSMTEPPADAEGMSPDQSGVRFGTPVQRRGGSRAGRPSLTGSTVRGLWLAIAILAAVLVGAAAGLLSWAGGLNPPNAVLAGGGAFGGAVMLAVALLRFGGGAAE